MRLTRCFVDTALTVGRSLALPEAAANHLRVMRTREGEDCVLFNGDGRDYAARLSLVSKREVTAELLSSRVVDNESPLHITLLQGIARGEKMDLILQKATELGVAAVVPVDAERTEVKLDGDRLAKRMTHWRSVIIAGCEQSGRAIVPALAQAGPLLAAAQATDSEALRVILDPQGELSLATMPAPAASKVVIAIGPEGGWSPRDREALRASGFVGLQLGPRILRTETAGLAAIAALQARFGDLG
ncbi:16S rRNA (uracil(1498)-N(3))-methyltransferase [Pseudoxanthomonas indica]|uniref:Ribosomal RNA small subunit methyltransferase E n=1 Tax=Pseudoxanthomonas indica TaxID=428993 RepID=A0A1T5LI20_9GAMM|nr:16S rRNA (uracil(1498)-N(3))-methyltransferase [Pseudoxanthomonas indica]GGD35465.1 ribosomal RNA small subunit methyltransferase E [Pseudoxanthomonas indica]SKC75643.1 16S rRNA (uracil1498-N3)-methyltransferase [Pseudoxanthomonas indica]